MADVGGGSYHVGDEAMLEANLLRLATDVPHAEVTVLGRDAAEDDIAAALARAQGLVVSGGGNLASHWPELLRARVLAIGEAARRGVPVALGGQTLGPELTAGEREALGAALATVACVGARDVPSARLAAELGVRRERIFYQVDDAFRLPPRPPPQPLARAAERPYLAVTIDGGLRTLEPLAAQLAAAARDGGLHVVFLPHVGPLGGAGDEDGAVGEALRGLLARAGVECTTAPVLPAAETAWMTRRAAAVVSTRYHPLVFATAAAVPCLGVHRDRYTRVKLQGALGHVGLQAWSMSAADAEAGALAPALERLCRDRARLRAAMRAAAIAIGRAEERRWHHLLDRLGVLGPGRASPGPAPSGWPAEERLWAFAADAAPPAPSRVVTRAEGATSRPMDDDAGSATTTTAAPRMLTDEQWHDFDRDGFLHLGRVVEDDELDALRRRADDLALGRVHNDEILMQLDTGGAYDELPGAVPELGTRLYRKIQGLECDDVFRPLVVHPLFLGICERMYGPHAPVSLFRAMVMNKPAGQGTVLPWHQDGGDVWKLDRDPLVTIWVALDDATVANGCMEAVRGSHRKGLLTAEGSTVSDADAAIHCPPELVVPLEVAAGHGLLLHNWLIHRSGVNPSSAPRRAFTGCYMDGRTISVLTGATFPLVAGSVAEGAHPYVAQLETDRAALGESFRAAEEYAHSLRERCTAAEEYADSLEERCRVAEEYARSLEAERARSGDDRGRRQRAADRVRFRFRSGR